MATGSGNQNPDPADSSHSGLSGLAHSEDRAEVVARYDGWVSTYDKDLDGWGYEVPAVLARRMAGALEARDLTGPVLDAGCGTGLIGRALAEAGVASIVGVDASAESLDRAMASGVYDAVFEADLLGTLDFDTGTFAGVACGGVLTYLADTEHVLRELLRVTRPGGCVIATQRTDLWVERNCEAAMESLNSDVGVSVAWSDPEPYLPGHSEYADDILVIYITAIKS